MPRKLATLCLALPLVVAPGYAAWADDSHSPAPFGAAIVPEPDLSTIRGGERPSMTFVASLANTVVTNTNTSTNVSGGAMSTGNVTIGRDALSSAGLGNYLINTGVGSNLGAAIGLSITVYAAPLP